VLTDCAFTQNLRAKPQRDCRLSVELLFELLNDGFSPIGEIVEHGIECFSIRRYHSTYHGFVHCLLESTRRFVACSNAYASSINRGSLQANPVKLTERTRIEKVRGGKAQMRIEVRFILGSEEALPGAAFRVLL
jgi:hypothetical protein